MFTRPTLFNLQEVLVSMTTYLNDSFRSNKSLYLLLVTIKELNSFEEFIVLWLSPALSALGDGVKLPSSLR